MDCKCGHADDDHRGPCQVWNGYDGFCGCRRYDPDIGGEAKKARKRDAEKYVSCLREMADEFAIMQKHISAGRDEISARMAASGGAR